MKKAVALIAAVAVAAAWLRWRPFRVAIAGASMSPALEPGDWAVAVRVDRVGRGDIVVLDDPRTPGFELVKRVTRVGSEGVWIEGDSPAVSTDSRTFGPVPGSAIAGRVVGIYAPLARAGVVRGRSGR
ncbi:MAG: nickel-type superoxide dismutase maturation protease [Actinomycetota bacterium]